MATRHVSVCDAEHGRKDGVRIVVVVPLVVRTIVVRKDVVWNTSAVDVETPYADVTETPAHPTLWPSGVIQCSSAVSCCGPLDLQ